MKRKLLRYYAVGITTISAMTLGVGVAGAQQATVWLTGPESTTNIHLLNNNRTVLTNTNNVHSNSLTFQNARSGNANSNDNTIGGTAESGFAGNSATSDNTVGISNSNNGGSFGNGGGNGGATVNLTGPHSTTNITERTNNSVVESNRNVVTAANVTAQNARSGNANSNGNTWAGNASSGSAFNASDARSNVDIANSNSVPTSFGNGGNGDVSVGLTGPHSRTNITETTNNSFRQTNTNNVRAANITFQNARSGNASSSGNTIGGDASSGSALNSNSAGSNVSIQNQ